MTSRDAETLGDRFLKVDHAGEHGAVNIYRGQSWMARLIAPDLLPELREFHAHECGHRALFAAELQRRSRRRCRSYALCGIGGLVLGLITGLLGRGAIVATTVAVERVVLRHLDEQRALLRTDDPVAYATISAIVAEETAHHDRSAERIPPNSFWMKTVAPIVSASTETVIWLGMRL